MSLSVCLSVRLHRPNSKTARPNFTDFLCMLPVALARSSSDGVAIMLCTSRFTDDVMYSCSHTMGSVGRIKHDAMFRRVRQVAVPWTSDNYSVWLSSSECGTGGKVCYLRLPCRACNCCQILTSYRRMTSTTTSTSSSVKRPLSTSTAARCVNVLNPHRMRCVALCCGAARHHNATRSAVLTRY